MIPKVIHKIIIVDGGDFPKMPSGMKSALASFTDQNPGYEMRLYNGRDCIDYIKKHYDQRTLDCYNKLRPYAYRCDLFRYLVLYQEGGWYSDIRQVCKEPLDTLNQMNREFYVSRDCYLNPRYLYNAFIGSIPKHPIMRKMVDLIVWNIEHNHYGIDCLCPTGPGAFVEGGIDYLRFHADKCCVGQHILDGDKQGFLCFGKTVFIKNKYNNAQGADNTDIKGGNDYGEMWRTGDVYNA